jgi:hypothetical protein
MAYNTRGRWIPTSVLACLVGLSALAGAGVSACASPQDDGGGGYPAAAPGAIGLSATPMPPDDGATPGNVMSGPTKNGPNDGPVRLARFAYVSGNVSWRPDETAQWSDATVNIPLREGAQIWVADGGRAEIQFDDGSVVRFGSGAVATLQTLYSDEDGEFTEIKLNGGLATLCLKHAVSVYQVDTPLASVKAAGPSEFRLGVDKGLEVGVRLGKAVVEGQQNQANLVAGDYLSVADAQAAFSVGKLPHEDSWDLWNDERDDLLNDADNPAANYLPPDIEIVAGDLNDYGTWSNDATYGHVWRPKVPTPDWRPYHDGHWTWVAPFGWTWVSKEPWGWAPYHYGTWVYQKDGWAWVPGPAQQVWCPAVVHFSEYKGQVAWCPLAPSEVRYPPVLPVKFRQGNWANLFSVGQAGVYYVADRTHCVARAFDNSYVNQASARGQIAALNALNNGVGVPATNATGGSSLPGLAMAGTQRNTTNAELRFVPVNAVRAAGASVASKADFEGRGEYQSLPKGSADYFTDGKDAAPSGGSTTPMAGPIMAMPRLTSITPMGRFISGAPSAAVASRAVVAAPLPAQVQRLQANAAATSSGTPAVGARPAPTNRTGITTLTNSVSTAANGSVQTASGARDRQGSAPIRPTDNTQPSNGSTPRQNSAPSSPPPVRTAPTPASSPAPARSEPARSAPPPSQPQTGRGRG